MPLFLKNETLAKLYKDVLYNCLNNYEYETSPRGSKIFEITNACLELQNPTYNWFYCKSRDNIEKYLKGELLWYFSGRNDIEFIKQYSKFWEKIANSDGTANSAYGNLIFNQKNEYGYTEWQWAIESLLNDIDSRQAIIHFNKPSHLFSSNKDQVCTMYGIFLIRDRRLNFHIYMRSNDIIKGLTYDIPFFTFLQYEAIKLLRKKYVNLRFGSYFHNVSSLHLYESDINLCKQMLNDGLTNNCLHFPHISLIDEKGNCCKEIHDVINKNYVGDDQFFIWLQK